MTQHSPGRELYVAPSFMMPRPPSQGKSALLAVAVLLIVAKAGAFEERFAWDAPAACPGAAQVLSVVAGLTGEGPGDFSKLEKIQGVVERHGAGWQLSLTLVEGARRRSRVITAPSCEDLARAAGVAIALALDRSIEASPDPPGPALTATAEEPTRWIRGASNASAAAGAALPSTVAAEQVPATAQAALPSTVAAEQVPATAQAELPSKATTKQVVDASELHWLLEAEALLDAAALSSAAPGAGVAIGVRRRASTSFVHGLFLPTQREALGASASVELTLFAGGLRSCYEFAGGLLNTAACAGVEIGRLTARGQGLANASAFTDWWLAPSLGLALGSTLGSAWYFRLYGDALLPIFRERYWVNDRVLVHRPPSVGFRTGLAIGVELDGEDG